MKRSEDPLLTDALKHVPLWLLRRVTLPYWIDRDDVESICMLGVLKAWKFWKPERGAAFYFLCLSCRLLCVCGLRAHGNNPACSHR